MADIQPDQVALGAIFEYPDPVFSEEELWGIIKQHDADYERVPEEQRSQAGLIMGGTQAEVGEVTTTNFATKEDHVILFNPNGDITTIGDCSFVTIRSEAGKFEDLQDEVDIFDVLLDKFDIQNQLLFYEITVNGKVRVGPSESITRFYSTEVMNTIEDITGEESEASTAVVESDKGGDEEGWYRLLLDSFSIENPRKWRLKYNRRMLDREELITETEDIINEFIGITGESSE